MKKILLGVAFILVSAISLNAQNGAIGIRFGAGWYSNGELTYQMPLNDNRLEADLGLGLKKNDSFFSFTASYQWVFDIDEVDGLAWYVGPGAQVNYWTQNDFGFGTGVGGVVGAEYTFSTAPIQLSLDLRPMWNIIGNNTSSIAVSARYVF